MDWGKDSSSGEVHDRRFGHGLHHAGVKEYIHGGGFAADVPYLLEVVVIEDAGHFVNQEKPQEVTAHINDFFIKLQDKYKSF